MDDTHEAVLAFLGRNAEQGCALPDGSFAWSSSQCLEILKTLESTKVAVIEGEFFETQPIGLVPAYTGWSCERWGGETATDYAARSRDLAADHVQMEEHAEMHVVLTFSDQNEAA